MKTFPEGIVSESVNKDVCLGLYLDHDLRTIFMSVWKALGGL